MTGPGMDALRGRGVPGWKALSGLGRSQNETVAADGPNASRSRCRGSVSEPPLGKHASWILMARESYGMHHIEQSMRHEPCGVNHVE